MRLICVLAVVMVAFSLNVTTDKSQYVPGETVTYRVADDTLAGTDVNVTFYYPNGTAHPNYPITLTLSSTGENVSTHLLSTTAPAGTWYINVTNASSGEWLNSTTFDVLQNATTGYLLTNSSSYVPGESISINITAFDQTGLPYNGSVDVILYAPNGSAIANLSVNLTNGNGSADYVLGYYAPNGTWWANTSFNGTSFVVNATNRCPTIDVQTASVALYVGKTKNVSFNITAQNNFAEQINLTWDCNGTDCHVYNVTGDEIANGTAWNVVPNGTYAFTLEVRTNSSTSPGSYNVTLTATSTSNTSNSANTSIVFEIVLGSVNLSTINESASNTYFAKPNSNRTFNISVANNYYENETYTINVSIPTDGWAVNVSNGTDSVYLNSSNTASQLGLTVGSFSSEQLMFTVEIPNTSTNGNAKTLTILAVSTANSSRNATLTVTVKIPSFSLPGSTITVYWQSDWLNISIGDVYREGVNISGNISVMNYTIYNISGGAVNYSSMSSNSVVSINVSNRTMWPAGNYTLNITIVDNEGYNQTLCTVFKIEHEGLTLSFEPASYSAAPSEKFDLSVLSRYASGECKRPSVVGVSCIFTELSNDCKYKYTCTAPSISATYTLSASVSGACYISGALSCSFSPAMSASASANLTVSSSTTTQQQQSGEQQAATQGGGGEEEEEGELVIGNVSVAELIVNNGSSQVEIELRNDGSSPVDVNVSVSEEGNWSRFVINWTAPTSLGAGESAKVNFTITPRRWARPGTYAVKLNVGGVVRNLTVTIPYPDDNKSVHRWVDVAADGSYSIISLEIRNLDNYTKNLSIVENIPKDLVSNASELNATHNFTIIEADPIVSWFLTLAPDEKVEINYTVSGDASEANFTEPQVVETKVGVETTALEEKKEIEVAGNDWWLALVVSAVVGVLVFFTGYGIMTGKAKLPRKPLWFGHRFKFTLPKLRMWEKETKEDVFDRVKDLIRK